MSREQSSERHCESSRRTGALQALIGSGSARAGADLAGPDWDEGPGKCGLHAPRDSTTGSSEWRGHRG